MRIQTCVRFETAHRQYGDDSKCGYLHGHNWEAVVQVAAPCVGPIGYIIDFKDIKEAINRMDHTTILHEDDELVDILTQAGQKVYRLDGNPTCENLAAHIYHMVVDAMDTKTSISPYSVSVTLYENEDSYATYQGE